MKLDSLKRAVFGPPAVQWCGDLCATNPAFRLAIDDLPPHKLQTIAEQAETKDEFETAVFDAWN